MAMRHLWSLLLGLVLTPLIYAAAGIAAVRLADARGFGATAAIGLAAALGAGAVFALLMMVRFSPVGPVVAGLIYLGVTIWALVDRGGFESFVPADLFGEEGALHRPVGLGTALLAWPLLLTAFSTRRWRGPAETAATLFDAAPAYPTSFPSAAPTYTDPVVSAAPSYGPVSPAPAARSAGPSAVPTYEPPVYSPPSSASATGPVPAGDDTQRPGG
jgi:hypothetical protein